MNVDAILFLVTLWMNESYGRHLFVEESTHGKQRVLSKQYGCPIHSHHFNFNSTKCSSSHDLCESDSDCKSATGRICCFNGCIKKCRRPVLRKIKGAVHQHVKPKKARIMLCTTSVFPNHQQILCPQSYNCSIKRQENKDAQISNSGICMKDGFGEINPHKPLENPPETDDSFCEYKGKKYKKYDSFFISENNLCTCKDDKIISCHLVNENKTQKKMVVTLSEIKAPSKKHINDYR